MAEGAEVVKIIGALAREKELDAEILFEGLETAMIAAARKKYDDAIELDISVDRESGEIIGFRDGKLIDTATLGRIAAQTAKQVMIQKIREAEQDVVFGEYENRRGQLVNGTVQRFEGESVIIDLNKAEAIMPRHERVRTETYNPGDRIRCVIADVRKVGQRVRIVLSRTHPDLIRRLFELEIPEISDHVIEIKGCAREPGFRTKLAVVSFDTKVDCVGACVGIRGSRIRNIIDELNGEKIDIIRWSESPEVLIMNALKPAEIISITLDDDTGEAVVTVSEDQLSLAIGKRGQNVRLAARLTGWDVNITSPGGESRRGGDKSPSLSENEQRILAQFREGGEITAPISPAALVGEGKEAAEAAVDHDPLAEMAKLAVAKDKAEAAPIAEAAASDEEDPLAMAAQKMMANDENEDGGDATDANDGGVATTSANEDAARAFLMGTDDDSAPKETPPESAAESSNPDLDPKVEDSEPTEKS